MLKLYSLIFCCIYLMVIVSASDSDNQPHWGYKNDHKDKENVLPKKWHKHHKKCFGRHQSPIDINFGRTAFDEKLKELSINEVNNDETISEQWDIQNNGHSLKLKTNKIFRFEMKSEMYEFKQMHFHWRGSEHRVNGHKFAGELHLVHQSMNNTKMHAVVGFFIELIDNDNPYFNEVISRIKEIRECGSTMNTDKLALDRLVPLNLRDYYRYSGSLTTPGCDEVVEWIVMDKPVLGISEDQMVEFQSLRDKHGFPILSNSRPVQLLNGRQVKRSFYSTDLGHRTLIKTAAGFNSAQTLTAQTLPMIIFCLCQYFF